MGDRRNVVIKDGDSTVYLYTHWDGYRLPQTVQTALKRGGDRWTDGPYLGRIIFCEMIRDDGLDNTSGYGISGVMQDTNYDGHEVEIDVDAQSVSIGDQKWAIRDFVSHVFADEDEDA